MTQDPKQEAVLTEREAFEAAMLERGFCQPRWLPSIHKYWHSHWVDAWEIWQAARASAPATKLPPAPEQQKILGSDGPVADRPPTLSVPASDDDRKDELPPGQRGINELSDVIGFYTDARDLGKSHEQAVEYAHRMSVPARALHEPVAVCPCTCLTPCNYACPCASPYMSGYCTKCDGSGVLYASTPPAAPVAPRGEPGEGMVLVPREPTKEMIEASGGYTASVVATWRAMLAAAPPSNPDATSGEK